MTTERGPALAILAMFCVLAANLDERETVAWYRGEVTQRGDEAALLTAKGFHFGSAATLCSIRGSDGPCQVEAFVGREGVNDLSGNTCRKLDRATYIGRCSNGKLDGMALVNANGSTKSTPTTFLSYFSAGRIAYPALQAFSDAGTLTLAIDEENQIYGCVVFHRWDQSKTRDACPRFRSIYGDELFSESSARAMLNGSIDLAHYSLRLKNYLTN